MRNIYEILKERKNKKTRALIIMPEKDMMYWVALPVYAHMFIKPAYEEINDLEGLFEFIHYFLVEHSITDNPAKQMCIETIVFPLYHSITKRNYDTDLVAW
jgi:hypothetical protein